MSWLLPSALAIAGIAALATIALHFIARSRPIAEPLPTARFIPPRPIRARTRSIAFSDVLLLLLRLAALGAVGAAVAGPVFARGRGRVARVVVADRSRSTAAIAELRDSVRALVRPGDALVVMDSTAVSGTLDSLRMTAARGSLSAGLAGAMRAAAAMTHVDSIELVVVSPLAAEELDAATDSVRAAWRGRLRLVRVAPARVNARKPGVRLPGDSADALVAGLALTGVGDASGWIRLVHSAPSRTDSAWAADSGHVLLVWPHLGRDIGWRQRTTVDAIGAVSSPTGTLVARFPRLWELSGAVVARWADGLPAAVEHAHERGCIRDVGILIDPASDVALRQPFRDFVAGLLAPCGGVVNGSPIGAARVASLAGEGPLAPAGAVSSRGASSTWTPWLLVLAAALLTAELAMRRTERKKA